MSDSVPHPRFIDLDGCFNFRDLGGYRTTDGGVVAWGRLYRSDSLHRLTETGLAAFARLGLATVLDLRAHHEVRENTWAPPPGWNGRARHVPLQEKVSQWSDVDPAELAHPDFAAHHYGQIAKSGMAALRVAIETLAAPAALPAVFHCAAGKDRTGVLAALVLRLLGVPADTVADEYALSELGTARWEASLAAGHPDDTQTTWGYVPPAMLTAKKDTMLAFLRQIDGEYGSVDGFARQARLSAETLGRLRAGLLTGTRRQLGE
jgi:protein-tyrosine phosphatase